LVWPDRCSNPWSTAFEATTLTITPPMRFHEDITEILLKVALNPSNKQTINYNPWSWSYGSWIYNYLCNQCLSPLTLWVRIPLRRGVLYTTLCDKVCQWLTAGWWFSPGTPVSSINNTIIYFFMQNFLFIILFTHIFNTILWHWKTYIKHHSNKNVGRCY
jgi:hypothetical protein